MYTAEQLYTFLKSYTDVDINTSLIDQIDVLKERLRSEGCIVTEDLDVVKYFNQDMMGITALYCDHQQIIELSQISRLFNKVFDDSFWMWYMKHNYNIDGINPKDIKRYSRYLSMDVEDLKKIIIEDNIQKITFEVQCCRFKLIYTKAVDSYEYFLSTKEVEGYELIGKYKHRYIQKLYQYHYEDFETLEDLPFSYYEPVFEKFFNDDIEESMLDWRSHNCIITDKIVLIEESIKELEPENNVIYHPSIMNMSKHHVFDILQEYGHWVVIVDVELYLHRIKE